MRLFEFAFPPTYLCSKVELPIGSVIDQPHACDLGAAHEGALERRRPESALARDISLQLHTNPGKSAEYVYLVQPIGHVDRFHTGWLRKLEDCGNSGIGEPDQYATGFFSGDPIPEDQSAPWEYRALRAKILRRVGGRALWLENRLTK